MHLMHLRALTHLYRLSASYRKFFSGIVCHYSQNTRGMPLDSLMYSHALFAIDNSSSWCYDVYSLALTRVVDTDYCTIREVQVL